ncbi:AAA family ATPase [Vacuolonema iberomarrocanum]|uniref:AAA family ATPase n=1 Tax=Vacuolonema iberomarrocanum TaxID=3454632 RepID=UPI0019E20A8E|nr:AAA family ATPase [filamentous cyanobacterium LEGE 07170]
MVPLRLTLKNFLSYRDASLDFQGLHVACICGANGAGKSSLLEAIAWVIWGQSRANADDDVIHQGEAEARVDFTFCCQRQTYRVIRSRVRRQTSHLEFQIETPEGFRSLTARGMRATQQLIVQSLRLDYDTFVNSAYLRQGRADEFMLKRPGERKQVLADLLQLGRYDQLAEQAKERSRQLKAELEVLERTIASEATQLQVEPQLVAEEALLHNQQTALQQTQEQDVAALNQLQETRQQRQTWEQQRALLSQQQQHLQQECDRLHQEQGQLQTQQQSVEGILHQAEAIANGCNHYHSLQTEEEVLSAKFHAHQAAQAQRQQLQEQLTTQTEGWRGQFNRVQVQIDTLHQQLEELAQTLRKRDEIQAGLVQLQQARDRLVQMDQRQAEAAPLLQRRQQIQSELDRVATRLTARLEEVHATIQDLQQQQQRQPELAQAVMDVTTTLDYLGRRRVYQQQVREKGLERRSFLERLQERQREYEAQIAELTHKIQMLSPDQRVAVERLSANSGEKVDAGQQRETAGAIAQEEHGAYADRPSDNLTPLPPCPLCDRPLDLHHWELVLERYRSEQEDIQAQIWVIREQLSTSDREIQILRQEYREIEQELAHYNGILERRGQLQEKLQGTADGQTRLQQLLQEQAQLEQALTQRQFAAELQEELALLDATLQTLDYDDRDHALARGEVDRWRWAEIRQAELKQAERRRTHLQEKLPQLEAQQAEIQQSLAAIAHSPLQQEIDQLGQQIAAIAYNLEHHTALRQALREAQQWQWRQQELTQAQQTYPSLKQRLEELDRLLTERQQSAQLLTQQIADLTRELQAWPAPEAAIAELESCLQQRRQALDTHIAQLGRVQQQRQQLEQVRSQHTEHQHALQVQRRQLRVYQELAQAFGKNGIQALMIENVLPQLETEANHILGRLSNHQLHVQFVTQRSRRRNSGSKQNRLIDTLDILIADARGTRPYETYSGGEAFRINFAIRLALARLLALRSGMALQLLVVDEGFGTQDEAGCDRLISAIQAIADDFSCILTVTHMPRLKEAFQTRIEVYKTDQGSEVQLVV